MCGVTISSLTASVFKIIVARSMECHTGDLCGWNLVRLSTLVYTLHFIRINLIRLLQVVIWVATMCGVLHSSLAVTTFCVVWLLLL